MDLGTVKKRLNYHFYEDVRHFASDMALIWKNCYKYNGKEHEVSKIAEEIERIFHELMNTYGLAQKNFL